MALPCPPIDTPLRARPLKQIQKSMNNIIKYFHPTGKSLPNGIAYQRGFFLKECRDNSATFHFSAILHPLHHFLSHGLGGMIVFPVPTEAMPFNPDVIQSRCREICPQAILVGNSFLGQYVDNQGESFGKNFTTVEITALSTSALLSFATSLASTFHQPSVLIKNCNNGKIYLATP